MPYQQECLDTIIKTFKEKNSQFIQLPTGSGKTAIFLNYVKQQSKRCLIVAPTKEIKNQILHSSSRWGLSSIGVKTYNRYPKTNHFICTAQALNFPSCVNYIVDKKYDTVIFDEAHHALSDTYKRFISKLPTHTKLLGVTATPERLDGQSLMEIFSEFSYSKSLVDMIKERYLSDIKCFRIKTKIDLKDGYFNKGNINKAGISFLDSDSRNKLIIKTYKQKCIGKKTLIFCLSIKHSIAIVNLLRSEGFKAAHISGDSTNETRKKILSDFKNGKIDVLTNCQLLTEGFDEPSIESIIISRPTMSKGLYTQMVGRGVRKYPGKEFCYLYELTDNSHDICNFNVLVDGSNPRKDVEYFDGQSLLDLDRYHKNNLLSVDHVDIDEEEFSFFSKKRFYNNYYYNIDALPHQLNKLSNHPFNIDGLTYIEAAFLIWKEKLKEKYGYHKKKK